ncbi:MAG: hypothetical protein PHG69_02185, partial [Candidatus Omnitrophica bacterium]|nr:hypothetical protein [Candidatus Omnitrophota bacterium]
MHKQILIITDRLNCLWVDEATKNNNNLYHYDLLTLGFNGEVSVYYNENKYKKMRSFNIIDVTKISELSQERVRKFIPDFIYEFPRRDIGNNHSILNNFSYKDINFWWFNKMSEKGAWGTPLIKRVYYLDLIIRVIKEKRYQEIWLELEDEAMSDLLNDNPKIDCPIKMVMTKRYPKARGFWFKLFINIFLPQIYFASRWLIFKLLRFGMDANNTDKASLKKTNLMFFTIYPSFWNISSQNKKTEVFFQSLPERLGENFNVHYLGWLPNLGQKYLLRNYKKVKKELTGEKVIPLDIYLRFSDLFSIFLASFSYVFKVMKYKFNLESGLSEF